MAISTTQKLTLEPAAQAFADANANPPFLSDLGPENGRRVLDEVQSGRDRPSRRRRGGLHRPRRPARRGADPPAQAGRRDRPAAR